MYELDSFLDLKADSTYLVISTKDSPETVCTIIRMLVDCEPVLYNKKGVEYKTPHFSYHFESKTTGHMPRSDRNGENLKNRMFYCIDEFTKEDHFYLNLMHPMGALENVEDYLERKARCNVRDA